MDRHAENSQGVVIILFKHLSPYDRSVIKELRNRGIRSRKKKNRSGYVALWKEQDSIEEKQVDALALVLRTPGCTWSNRGNCSMCGYFVDSGDAGPVIEQFENAMIKKGKESMLKIYTSGSFLDTNEISAYDQKWLLDHAYDMFDRVLIESRPEYIQEKHLEKLGYDNLEIAMGLESANDEVLIHSINKGFRFSDYETAAQTLVSLRIPLRTYLILKPPFMTEAGSIRDAMSSIRAVEQYSETVSVNPMNIQRFTFVDHLFRRGQYRPPYIWSLLKVLATETSSRWISSPSGGGSSRGVSNCGTCDKPILERIKYFSHTGDRSMLEYDCDCKGLWEDALILEDAVQRPLVMERDKITRKQRVDFSEPFINNM